VPLFPEYNLKKEGQSVKEIKFSTSGEIGLHPVVADDSAALDVLSLYSLRLLAAQSHTFSTDIYEVCLVNIKGVCTITIDDLSYTLREYDCLYLPRRIQAVIAAEADSQLAICKAEALEDTEIILRRFEDSCRSAEGREVHGKYNYTRDVVNLLFRSDKASRLVAGISMGQDGLWTSWPPHHHSDTLEEIYYYFGMPANGFGIHVSLFMDGTEQADIVHTGDAIAIASGYHPTVASPGSRMKYLWFLGAKTNESDRRAQTINHPVYE
jgi:5-deoxy-glucuronate isomerase